MAFPEYPYYICSEFFKKTKLPECDIAGKPWKTFQKIADAEGTTKQKNPAEDEKFITHRIYKKQVLKKPGNPVS